MARAEEPIAMQARRPRCRKPLLLTDSLVNLPRKLRLQRLRRKDGREVCLRMVRPLHRRQAAQPQHVAAKSLQAVTP